VNVYLAPQEDGWILVDCGMELRHLLAIYESRAIEWQSIRQTLLTRFHADRTGFASTIHQLTGAPVRMPRREGDLLNRLRAGVHLLSWQDRLLLWAGLLDPARGCVRTVYPPSPPPATGAYLEDGEIIPTALGPMQALLTPGHSHAQICFYLAEPKLLLAGDRFFDAGARRASLRQIHLLDVDWILPSHGMPLPASECRIESFLDCSRQMSDRIDFIHARGNDLTRDLVARALARGRRGAESKARATTSVSSDR
jgi:glyoxylase-like metal-dependent hydrolase (beta-lactamase superfamily II)